MSAITKSGFNLAMALSALPASSRSDEAYASTRKLVATSPAVGATVKDAVGSVLFTHTRTPSSLVAAKRQRPERRELSGFQPMQRHGLHAVGASQPHRSHDQRDCGAAPYQPEAEVQSRRAVLMQAQDGAAGQHLGPDCRRLAVARQADGSLEFGQQIEQ